MFLDLRPPPPKKKKRWISKQSSEISSSTNPLVLLLCLLLWPYYKNTESVYQRFSTYWSQPKIGLWSYCEWVTKQFHESITNIHYLVNVIKAAWLLYTQSFVMTSNANLTIMLSKWNRLLTRFLTSQWKIIRSAKQNSIFFLLTLLYQ
jgi:hypothetical protein